MTSAPHLVLDRHRGLVGVYALLAALFACLGAVVGHETSMLYPAVLWLFAVGSAAVSGGRVEVAEDRLVHRRWWGNTRAVTLGESTTAQFSDAWKGRITVADGCGRVVLGERGFPPELWVPYLPVPVDPAPPNRWARTQLRGSLLRVRPSVLTVVVAASAVSSLVLGTLSPAAGALLASVLAMLVMWLCAWRQQRTLAVGESPDKLVAPFVGNRTAPGWAPQWMWERS